MSRRRSMSEWPKKWNNLKGKRLQLVRTGGARPHGVVVLDIYFRPDIPSRPDFQSVMRSTRSAAFPDGGLPPCGKCEGSKPFEFDEEAHRRVLQVLETATPGVVLRYDVSTGRVLES